MEEQEIAAAPMDPLALDALLRLFAFDNTTELWWRGKDGVTTGPLEFYVNVNDVFTWGSEDLEPIDLTTDLPGLAQAKQDTLPEDYGWSVLWTARKRGQRPAGAAYFDLPENIWPLLDRCGPERPVDTFNPFTAPRSVEQNSEVSQ